MLIVPSTKRLFQNRSFEGASKVKLIFFPNQGFSKAGFADKDGQGGHILGAYTGDNHPDIVSVPFIGGFETYGSKPVVGFFGVPGVLVRPDLYPVDLSGVGVRHIGLDKSRPHIPHGR
jgi:hypothetical protein